MNRTKNKPSLINNAMSNYLALAASLVVGFLTTPYIIDKLGKPQFGIWTLIGMIVGYYGLFDLGINAAAMRYVALYAGKGEKENLNKTVNSALVLFTSLGLVMVILSIAVPGPLINFFKIEPSDQAAFKNLVYLMGVTAGFMFPGKIFEVILLGQERFVLHNCIQIVFNIIRSVGSVYVLYRGGGLTELGWIFAVTSFLSLVLHIIFVKIVFPDIHYSLKYFQKPFLLSLISFGFFTTVAKVGDVFRFKMDEAVIGKFMNMEAVGIYAVAMYLFRYLFRVTGSANVVTMPRLSALAGNDKEQFKQAFMQFSMVISVLTVGMAVMAFVLGGDFMALWLPESFKEIALATAVLQVLIVGVGPDLMTAVSLSGLIAIKKHQYFAYQTIAEGIANLILSIILVERYGIIGVAFGSAIPCIITRFIIQPLYASRLIGFPLWRYIWTIIVKPSLLFAATAVIYNFTLKNILVGSYFLLAVKTLIVFGFFSGCAYLFCLGKEEKNILHEKIGMALTKLKALRTR